MGHFVKNYDNLKRLKEIDPLLPLRYLLKKIILHISLECNKLMGED